MAAFHQRHAQTDASAPLVTPAVDPQTELQFLWQQAAEQERQWQLEDQQRAQQVASQHQRSENAPPLPRIETGVALLNQSKPTPPAAQVKSLVSIPPRWSKPRVPLKTEPVKTVSDPSGTVSEAEESGSGLGWVLGTMGALWLISEL